MRRLIFIGTLHGGTTDEVELKSIIEGYRPDLLLVEIVQEDVEKRNIKKYPQEMIFAYNWARRRGIRVKGFDAPIKTTKEDFTEQDNQELIKKSTQFISLKKLNWKEFNKEENVQLLNDLAGDITIEDEDRRRNEAMLINIKSSLLPKGTIVVLTGAGHLSFFEKKFPEAEFPLRHEQKSLKRTEGSFKL